MSGESMQPEERGGQPDPGRSLARDGRERLTTLVLAVLSALFFTGALAYGLGSGLLTGGGDGEGGAADRNGRTLPREWATMIPLRPLGPELDPDSSEGPDASEVAGARDDSTGSERAAPAGSSARPRVVVPAARRAEVRSPRVRPAVVLSLTRRTPIVRRVVGTRLPELVDLTPTGPELPQLPDTDDVDLVPDIDVLPGGGQIPPILPGGVQIPPILPDGVQIPPILPGGVRIPPIDLFPGGVNNPPIDPVPGGGLPLPGGGLPRPGGGLGSLPPSVLVSVASFESLDVIGRRREADDLDRAADGAPTTGLAAVVAERAGGRGLSRGDAGGKSLRAKRRAARRSADRSATDASTSAEPSLPGRDLRRAKRKGPSPAPETAEPQRRDSDRCPDRPRRAEDPEGAELACDQETEAGESTNAPPDPGGDRQEPGEPKARLDPGEEDDA